MVKPVDQLVFVGLNGYAVALDRDTGDIVWSNNELKSGYVTLLLDGDRRIVSTNGFIFCLDPLTGQTLWNNPMKGYGIGTPTSLMSARGQSSQTIVQQAAVWTWTASVGELIWFASGGLGPKRVNRQVATKMAFISRGSERQFAVVQKKLGNVHAVWDIESPLFDKLEVYLKADSCPFGELRVGGVE